MTKKTAEAAAQYYLGQKGEMEFDGIKIPVEVVAIVPAGEKVWGGTTLGDFNHRLGLDIGEYNVIYLDQSHTRNETREEESVLVAEHHALSMGLRRVYWPNEGQFSAKG
jgi:hypothetical protein